MEQSKLENKLEIAFLGDSSTRIPFVFRLWDTERQRPADRWCVKLASFGYSFYDSSWMNDDELGVRCLVPDVDIEGKSFVFDSENDALVCAQKLWATIKLAPPTPEPETYTGPGFPPMGVDEYISRVFGCPECGGKVSNEDPHDACVAAHHARSNID